MNPTRTALPASDAATEAFRRDVVRGLSRPRKRLPCKYFYDARGSALFDQICELEEYYPTRCEAAVLRRHAGDIAAAAGPGCALVEYGSGSSTKTRLLLDHLSRPAAYVPVDISGEHLFGAARRLARHYPGLAVRPVCADFTRPFELPPLGREAARRVVFFSGSTIGNFRPPEAVASLGRIAGLVGPSGGLLIGVDLKKDRRVLDAAYNDRRGVTAEFNLNLLARINRELSGDFDLGRFRHHAFFNERRGRIEMHLVSVGDQTVHVGDAAFSFADGESVCTEYSYKYAVNEFRDLAARAGFTPEHVWTDPDGLYSVQFLSVQASQA
jgi:dimethylhistidine N-methyltransferase